MKFQEGYRVGRQTSEEGQRALWPKRCKNNNQNEQRILKKQISIHDIKHFGEN